jgi:hypothetical protein
MRPHGRASVDSSSPRAFGCCDRCNFWYNRDQLSMQMEWGGRSLLAMGIYVCERCLDEPNPGLKSIILPPDPVPVYQPRVDQNLQLQIDDVMITEDEQIRLTEEDDIRTPEGNPP